MKFPIRLVLILSLIWSTASSQKLESFNSDRLWKVFIIKSTFYNSSDSVSYKTSGFYSAFFSASRYSSSKWGFSGEYQNRFGGDLMANLVHTIRNGEFMDNIYNWMSNSWFGDLSVGTNVLAGEQFVLCTGINLSDWRIHNELNPEGSPGYKWGYTAWHFCYGAYVRADYAFSEKFALRLRSTFVYSGYNYEYNKSDKIKTYILTVNPEVLSRGGWFLGAEFYRDFSSMSSHIERWDFKLGLHF